VTPHRLTRARTRQFARVAGSGRIKRWDFRVTTLNTYRPGEFYQRFGESGGNRERNDRCSLGLLLFNSPACGPGSNSLKVFHRFNVFIDETIQVVSEVPWWISWWRKKTRYCREHHSETPRRKDYNSRFVTLFSTLDPCPMVREYPTESDSMECFT